MSIEEKATAAQENLESKFSKLGTGKYGRIIRMCRTPTTEEYKRSLLIVAAGLAVLGVVGFGIYWLMSYLPGYF
ncbi:MAG: protein translocase SEC61 complex subunit gamma [Candidatus Methanomethylophilaceae archaeon]|jgi:protein transport protein SEC61 subunit gamma-like protein|nr:protein translocase SEC61 complex subunit gamma [Candidatus Methanomethylophilaceae archaeon]MBO5668922.1 protein translocase SEC61 complex subunit gamma [Candidatus Methanomethylophilaceae archaeon]MBO7205195.1 protein translocase SEC61 complex subunit gamma [Candidatus Methanomethylophilaceae archaeon]